MTAPLSATARGAAWMTVSMVFFTVMTVLLRYLSHTIPAAEQVFFRSAVVLVVLAPWTLRRGVHTLRTRRWALLAGRALCTGVGIVTWIYAIAIMEMADAVALHFTLPLFGVVMAAIMLRETVTRHRWIATAVGFSGAVVILRPGFIEVEFVSLVVLFSAAVYALGGMVSKVLVRTEAPSLVVFYMNGFLLIGFALPAALVWVAPGRNDLVMLLALGLTTVIAQICLTRAFVAADASAVLPFEFLRLPMTAAAGYALFGEAPDAWTWIGAVIIFGATYYIVWCERRNGAAGGGAP